MVMTPDKALLGRDLPPKNSSAGFLDVLRVLAELGLEGDFDWQAEKITEALKGASTRRAMPSRGLASLKSEAQSPAAPEGPIGSQRGFMTLWKWPSGVSVSFDEEYGGFRRPKFSPHNLALLQYWKTGDKRAFEMVDTTLGTLCRRHL